MATLIETQTAATAVETQSLESDSVPLRQLDSKGHEVASSSSNSIHSPPLPPIDGGYQAWLFLACATMLETLIWGLSNAYGSFLDYHTSSPSSPLYGSSSALLSAIGSIMSAGNYFAPWLFSSLYIAYPHRIWLFSWTGLILSSLGLLGASFHPTPISVLILQGFFSLGTSVFYLPAILWLPQWFDEKRGLATGIMFLGSGVGGVVWPYVLSALLAKVGFGWTLRCLCLIQVVVGAVAAFFMRPRLPLNEQRAQVRSRRRSFLRTIVPKHDSALNSILGALTITLQFLHSAAFKSIAYYIAPYATTLGLSNILSTTILAALNAASALSYVATGKMCDVLHHGILILLINIVATILVATLFGLASNFALLLSFAILYGLCNGGFSTTLSPMARQMAKASSSDSSPVFLEYLAWRGVGGLVGPLITASLYKPKTSPTSTSIWSPKAVYGSHGLGPVVIFTTAISGIVALLSIFVVISRNNSSTRR
jgi:MFS family permease